MFKPIGTKASVAAQRQSKSRQVRNFIIIVIACLLLGVFHVVRDVLHDSSPPPSAPPPVTLPSGIWGYHHLYFEPHELEPCPKQWAVPGLWGKPQGGYALPFTAEAQEAIYKLQNPPDCAKAKFLVYEAPPAGIGSLLHGITVAMAIAFEHGRIFIEQKSVLAVNVAACGRNATTLDTCYFLPLTNCPIPSTQELNAAPMMTNPAGSPTDERQLRISSGSLGMVRTLVPSAFLGKIKEAGIPDNKTHYWWRAQGVAYMMRPNQRTTAEIEARKRTKLRNGPLRPGCISLHVRHGDKGVESPTFDDPTYDNLAQKLKSVDQRTTDQLFLSTEDPETVAYFNRSLHWKTVYTDVPRKPEKGVSNFDYMSRIGFYEETINSLLNLDLALECAGFAGSIYSNWVRLIDELRSTVRCKADAVFMDTAYADIHTADVNW